MAIGKGMDILPRAQIAIVANRVFAFDQSRFKRGHIHVSRIECLSYPGVDDQQGNGIAVVDFQKPFEFFGVFHSQSGFQRDGQGGRCENCIQKSFQAVRVTQHSGALSFGKHRPRRAAQIQIDFAIASVCALPGRPEKILCTFGQQLGYGGEAFAVCQRQLLGLPLRQAAVDSGGEEGHIVFIYARKILVVQTPVDAVGQPLHGGKIVFHSTS